MRKEITHGGSRRNLIGGNPAEELVVKLRSGDTLLNYASCLHET
jgi:hypothetical protein